NIAIDFPVMGSTNISLATTGNGEIQSFTLINSQTPPALILNGPGSITLKTVFGSIGSLNDPIVISAPAVQLSVSPSNSAGATNIYLKSISFGELSVQNGTSNANLVVPGTIKISTLGALTIASSIDAQTIDLRATSGAITEQGTAMLTA